MEQIKKKIKANNAVEVNNVWESFRIYHHKNYTIKDTLVRLKKSKFEEFWALKDISFKVHKGETLGIIGENGSGKSTLLKCIAGVLPPSKGKIIVKGKVSPLLELGAGFHPELSGKENIYVNGAILGLTKKQIDERYDDIVAFSELENFIDTQVKFYSSGMYIRLGFAVAVFSDPDILLVDEILAVGDESFKKKSFDKMKEFKEQEKTIILVTHDMGSASQFCDRVVLLKNGVMEDNGSPKNIVNNYIAESLEEKPSEKGSKEVVITNVEIFDNQEQARKKINPGEFVEIKINYKAKKPIKSPLFHLVIHDQQANLYLSTNNELTGLSIKEINGEGSIHYKIRNLPIQNGTFYISIAIVSKDYKIYHMLENCLKFEVAASISNEGLIFAQLECNHNIKASDKIVG